MLGHLFIYVLPVAAVWTKIVWLFKEKKKVTSSVLGCAPYKNEEDLSR